MAHSGIDPIPEEIFFDIALTLFLHVKFSSVDTPRDLVKSTQPVVHSVISKL